MFREDMPEQPRTSEGVGRHLLLYDGVCGLCNRVTRFVLRFDRREVFDFAPLQSATGRDFLLRLGENPGELNTFYVAAGYRTRQPRILSKSRAALFVITALGWPWRLFGLFRLVPAPLLDVCYDVVARRRYQVFGRYDTCPMPSPEQRRRFIDVGPL